MRKLQFTPEERFWPKVDKTNTCWHWTAKKTRNGYGQFYLDGSNILAHRVSYAWSVGQIPEGMEIDHICHNRACVNPDHMRLATHKQNAENAYGSSRNSKSGVRGVWWSDKDRGWRACVQHDGKKYRCGQFKTVEEATAAVIAKRNELFTFNDMDRR